MRAMLKTAGTLAVWSLLVVPARAGEDTGKVFDDVVREVAGQVKPFRGTPAPVIESVKAPGPEAGATMGTPGPARLEATNTRAHFAREDLMPLELHRCQQVLARYLEGGFGCSKVELCLSEFTPVKSRFFRSDPGTFTMKLTATCREAVPGFRFDVGPASDWEEYTDVLIGHGAPGGSWVEKDIVARTTGADIRRGKDIVQVGGCDSSPIDPSLPYVFITSPDMRRTFPK